MDFDRIENLSDEDVQQLYDEINTARIASCACHVSCNFVLYSVASQAEEGTEPESSINSFVLPKCGTEAAYILSRGASENNCNEACEQVHELGLEEDFEVETYYNILSSCQFTVDGSLDYGGGQNCYIPITEFSFCTRTVQYLTKCSFGNWSWNRSQ